MQSDHGNRELLFLFFPSCFLPLPSEVHSGHGAIRKSQRTSSCENTCFHKQGKYGSDPLSPSLLGSNDTAETRETQQHV